MRTSVLAIVVVLIVLLGLGWWWYSHNPAPASTAINVSTQPAATDQGMADNGVTSSSTPTSVTVTYNGSSFSPASVTVPVGGTVTWIDTSGTMWIASDPHPVHDGYDGTTRAQHCAAGYSGAAPFDECSLGNTFTFTFTKAGTFGYHDHHNHDATGSVTVQ